MDSARRLPLEWRNVAHRRRSAMTLRALAFLACSSLLAALGATVPAPGGAPPSNNDLPLRDFKPRSMLVVPEHPVSRGARGLKVTKVLGLEVHDRTGRLVTVDDPRLDPMWAECGRLGIPVAIHTSDPDAFFEPVDATNERWDELHKYPEWSFHGPRFPGKRALLDARNRVSARHPGPTFIALHVA